MKKLFLFFALTGTIAFTSCSKDNDDASDAIVGTWAMESSITPEGSETTTYRDEWIFKSDKTGNYKETTNDEIGHQSAFTWSKSEDAYIVKYTEEDFSDDEVYKIGDLMGNKTLEDNTETTVAIKE